MNDDGLRIGDAERTQAADELGEHYAQGRLTTEEHHERLDQVWAARTRAELAPIFRDLPGSTYAAASSYRSARQPGVGAERGPWGSRSPMSPMSSMSSMSSMSARSSRSQRRGQGMRRWTGSLPPVVPIVLAVLAVVFVVTHLPFILIGLLVWFVVFHKIGRHRGHTALGHRRW